MKLSRRDLIAAVAGATLAFGLSGAALAEDLPYNLKSGKPYAGTELNILSVVTPQFDGLMLRDKEFTDLTGIETLFVSGFREFTRLSEQANADPDAIMQGVQRAMRVSMTREEERLERHLAFLATVGSTSPYVGLFGTVWGIMNSFRSPANMSQATLASVAPGISEALVATAMGLFAAIPAVIGFNRFSSRVEVLTKRYETFAEECRRFFRGRESRRSSE